MRLDRFGISVQLQPGWDVRIYRRAAAEGESPHPVLHAATIRMPSDRGDYGSGVVSRLGADDAFVALVEFGDVPAAGGLFAHRGVPAPQPRDFAPHQLHRALPGQSGWQTFFRAHDRGFALYVVLGSHSRRLLVTPRVRGLLASLEVAR